MLYRDLKDGQVFNVTNKNIINTITTTSINYETGEKNKKTNTFYELIGGTFDNTKQIGVHFYDEYIYLVDRGLDRCIIEITSTKLTGEKDYNGVEILDEDGKILIFRYDEETRNLIMTLSLIYELIMNNDYEENMPSIEEVIENRNTFDYDLFYDYFDKKGVLTIEKW